MNEYDQFRALLSRKTDPKAQKAEGAIEIYRVLLNRWIKHKRRRVYKGLQNEFRSVAQKGFNDKSCKDSKGKTVQYRTHT